MECGLNYMTIRFMILLFSVVEAGAEILWAISGDILNKMELLISASNTGVKNIDYRQSPFTFIACYDILF